MEDRTTRADGYRTRAEELRTIAETLKEPESKAKLLRIADDYARMAEAVENPRI
jgi:hypothetical protein